jgi:hypothetical protein
MRWAYMPFVRWHLNRLDRLDREKDDKLRVREKQVNARGEERLSKKEQKLRDRVIVRFAEQAWTCTYASVFWSLGMVSWLIVGFGAWRLAVCANARFFVPCDLVYPASCPYEPLLIAIPLAQLPSHSVEPFNEILLPRPIGFLVPSTIHLQPRSETKGLLSDVGASFRHDRFGHGELLGELYKSRDSDSRLDGFL